MRFCFDGDCCNYCNFLSLLSIALGVVAQSPEPGAHVKNSSPGRKCAGAHEKNRPPGKNVLKANECCTINIVHPIVEMFVQIICINNECLIFSLEFQ